MLKVLTLAVLSGTVIAPAFAQGSLLAQGTVPMTGNVQSPQASDTPSSIGGDDSRAKNKLSNADFIEKAALAGMAEIGSAKLAEKKALTPAVREFAARMIKDHTEANNKLRSVAAPLGAPVPQQLDRVHSEGLKQLGQLSGREFDTAYVNLMRQDHDTAVALFENAAGDGALDEKLRTFARNTLDTLRNHQLQAHNLNVDE